VIDLAILGLLQDQDLHGYELKKRLGELPGAFAGVSFGSLYPALARLERAGAVREVEGHRAAPAPNVPMTGALSGEIAAFRARSHPGRERDDRVTGRRNRKVYGITASGRTRLETLLVGTTADDRTFALQVAFGRHLRPEQRVSVFERRRSDLAERLRTLLAQPAAAGRNDQYLQSLREHDARVLTNDLAWVDELVALARLELDDAGQPVPTSIGGIHP